MSVEADQPQLQSQPVDRAGLWIGLVFSAVLLALALVMVTGAAQMRLLTASGPGSGFLPLVVGVLLTIVSALYMAQKLMGLRAARTMPAAVQMPARDSELSDEPSADAGLGRAAVIVLSLVLLAGLLEYLGFQLSMFVFLIFHLKVLGRQNWLTALPVAAFGSFGAFALFSGLLRVTLPYSDIPFLAGWGL